MRCFTHTQSGTEFATRMWLDTDVRHCRETTSEEYHAAHVQAVFAACGDSKGKTSVAIES